MTVRLRPGSFFILVVCSSKLDLPTSTLYGALLALKRTLDNPDKQEEYIFR